MELKGQLDEKEEVSYEEKGSHDFFLHWNSFEINGKFCVSIFNKAGP